VLHVLSVVLVSYGLGIDTGSVHLTVFPGANVLVSCLPVVCSQPIALVVCVFTFVIVTAESVIGALSVLPFVDAKAISDSAVIFDSFGADVCISPVVFVLLVARWPFVDDCWLDIGEVHWVFDIFGSLSIDCEHFVHALNLIGNLIFPFLVSVCLQVFEVLLERFLDRVFELWGFAIDSHQAAEGVLTQLVVLDH